MSKCSKGAEKKEIAASIKKAGVEAEERMSTIYYKINISWPFRGTKGLRKHALQWLNAMHLY